MDNPRPYEEENISTKLKKNWVALTALVAAIAVIGGIVWFVTSQASKRASEYKYEGLISKTDPTFGKKDSNLEVVIIEDYFCPHCKNNNPLFDRAVTEYSDRVKFVYKPIQVLTGSKEIIPFALAADKQGKFLELSTAIYKENDKVYNLRKEAVKNLARNIPGLDYDKWLNDATNDQGIKDKINDIQTDIKKTYIPGVDGQAEKKEGDGFPGTPGVIVIKDGKVTNWWTGEISMSAGEEAAYKELQSRLEKGFGGSISGAASSAANSTAVSK